MKALKVLIDGEPVGVYVPPVGATFTAMVGNIPRKYMRADIMTGTDAESWQWQLDEITESPRYRRPSSTYVPVLDVKHLHQERLDCLSRMRIGEARVIQKRFRFVSL